MRALMTRSPSPFEGAYAALLSRAQDAATPTSDRFTAAMKAGDLAAPRDGARAVEAYRLAAALDPLDGRAAIAAAAQLAKMGALAEARTYAAEAFRSALEESVRADAAFLLGEIALGAEALDEAGDAFQAAEQLFDGIHRRDRTDPDCLHAIARLNLRLTDVALMRGDIATAAKTLPKAAALLDALQRQGADHPALSADARACIDRQIDLALAQGDLATAQSWMDRLIPLAEAAAAERDDPGLRNLAATRLKESRIAESLGETNRAIAAADAAVGRLGLLATRRPEDAVAGRELARALKRRAELDVRFGPGANAAAWLKEAAARLDALLGQNPAHAGLARERAAVAVLAGDAAFKAKDLAAASAHYEDARDRCVAFAHHKGPWPLALATAHDRLGDVALARGQAPAARIAYGESLNLRRAAAAQAGAADKRALAVSASKLGEAALAQGDLEAARAAFKESLRLRLGLLSDNEGDPALRRQVALSLERVALAALARGERQEARAAFEDELALAQEDLLSDPDDPGAQRFTAVVRQHLAGLQEADAGAHRAEALRLLEALIAKGQATAQDLTLRDRLAGTRG